MSKTKTSYTIHHKNHIIELFNNDETIKLFSASWHMEFGKFGSEIRDKDDNLCFSIVKKFKFWVWKMVFTISKQDGSKYYLESQNNRDSIYKTTIDNNSYEAKIHYKKKISIFKNDAKIAEFDEFFSIENPEKGIQLLLENSKDIATVFLLFACLKIGEIKQQSKSKFTNQKQLEANEDSWF